MNKPRSSQKSRMSKLSKFAQSYRVPREVTARAIVDYFEALDCPRSLTACLLFRYNEHAQLVKLECDPKDFNNPEDFRLAYAATKFLSKSNFLKTGIDTKQVAMQKFEEFELLCKQTNCRFRALEFDPEFTGSNVWLLNATKRKISQVLGDFDVNEMIDRACWGPGVTNTLKGVLASRVNKFQREVGITRDLYSRVFLPNDEKIVIMENYPLWFQNLRNDPEFPKFEVGNVTVTVPKDAKTDRVISIEPGLNLWFQQGIGRMLRQRLFRRGVDLRKQEVNQHHARFALKRELSTVDFSSASDSISYELVRELLPPDWFEWMDICRSHYSVRTDSVCKWEKFSSMGNGFTFQLESLIFYSAAVAVAEYLGLSDKVKYINAYGDDVVIPCDCFELFSSFCLWLGFVVNRQKSFSSGVFRESCGSHYFDGVDVKPLFLKSAVGTPHGVYKLANAIRLLSHRSCSFMACDSRFRSIFYSLKRVLPSTLRFKVDISLGDVGFLSNFDEATPHSSRDNIEGYYVECAAYSAVKLTSDGIGLLLDRLHAFWDQSEFYVLSNSLTSIQQSNNYSVRGRTRIRVKRVLVHQWYDLGPWI